MINILLSVLVIKKSTNNLDLPNNLLYYVLNKTMKGVKSVLDSLIIGKVVDYGDYQCVVDNILDYKEEIIQLRITSGKYDGFSFSVDDGYYTKIIYG